MTDPIEQLTSLFEKFPGIGPRQAGRFVQFLLRSPSSVRRELTEAVQTLSESVRQCAECARFHSEKEKMCNICSNQNRDGSLLAVVASDADLIALEKSGTYKGCYFVLGGTISLASEKASQLRVKQLIARINDLQSHHKEFQEIILAFPVNPEGDATAVHVREKLADIQNIKVSSLGRGLSTGSELEYADSDTLKNALESRR